MENSLASQWLGLSAFTPVVQVLIPVEGTVIPQAVWPQPKEKKWGREKAVFGLQ